MTVYALLPAAKIPFHTSTGNLANGYQLFVYQAGTSTKATTYTDSTGLSMNANPIVLNPRGETPYGVYVASGSYKLVLAPQGDTDPPGAPIWSQDAVTPENDVSVAVATEWTASGLTPTYVSATSFTVPGNQTVDLHIGRRIKTINSGGTVYGTITNSVYAPTTTTVTVVNDSSALDAGLSSVSYGFLNATNPSEPTITGLSALTSVDISADYVAVLDTSASKMTKALAGYVGQGQRIASNIAASSGATVSLFTGITAVPYRQIVIVLKAVSLSGTDDILINLGDTGGYGSTTYDSTGSFVGNAGSTTARRSTAGILIPMGNAALTFTGVITLTLIQEAAIPGGDLWIASGNGIYPGSTFVASISGFAQLTSATPRTTLDRIQLSATGANTFDGSGVAFAYARF